MQIDGVLNFREVAGLTNMDGQHIIPGQLFRSGSFAAITPAGLAQFRALTITKVVDLRNAHEQQRSAFTRLHEAGVMLVGLRHELELGELAAVLRAKRSEPEDVARAMEDTYRKLPFYFIEIYREFFRVCLTHHGPLAVNCSVGKDRTGVGIALLLSILGMTRSDILAEYDKTNLQVDQIRRHLRTRRGANRYAQISDAVMAPVLWANPRYLEAMFAEVEEKAGSPLGYVSDVIGLGREGVSALRQRFLSTGQATV